MHKDLLQNGRLNELVTDLRSEGTHCQLISFAFLEVKTYAHVLQELICLGDQELVPCKN